MGGHVSEKPSETRVAELGSATRHDKGWLGHQRGERSEANLVLTVSAAMRKEVANNERKSGGDNS